MAKTVLKVENLVAKYGPITALKGISLEVREGELVSLLGANGAGKSTTLNTISGLLRSKTGSLTFRGENIGGMAPHAIVRKGIIHVPEGRRIFSKLTVEGNLEMGAYTRPGRELENAIAGVYDRFPRLKERRKQVAGTLSGGEQQMLAIGRALVSRPSLLMLDEPSMGLAPILVEQVFDIIREIHRSGVTVLLVEQNARMALSIADRGYVLETGRVVLSGPGPELLVNDSVRKAYLGS